MSKKKEYKYKPSMTTMTKGGTKQIPKLKALKLKQISKAITEGQKSSLVKQRQISAEEFDDKIKVKLKKKSGGYKKVVRK